MVSKVAVVALVAILAVPILMGYGLNLSEVTVTEYKTDGTPIDVTNLLANGTTYDYAAADIYQINSHFNYSANYMDPTFAVFNSSSSTNTSLPGYVKKTTMTSIGGYLLVDNFDLLNEQYDYNWAGGNYFGCEVRDSSNNVLVNIDYLHSYYMDYENNVLYYTQYIVPYPEITYGSINDAYRLNMYTVGTPTVTNYETVHVKNASGGLDISGGYYFTDSYEMIKLPEHTKSSLMTVNLDSISANSYGVFIGTHLSSVRFLKLNTAPGVYDWYIRDNVNNTFIKLYYDSSRSDNTYQIYTDYELDSEDSTYYNYTANSEIRYVGGWPTLIGEAPSYMTYNLTENTTIRKDQLDIGLFAVNLSYTSDGDQRTPTVRMDGATFNAFYHLVIKDKTYDPSTFRTNPSTKITDIVQFGKSLTFGGQTFNVTKGNITLGTHQVSVKNMVFDSTPAPGGYANRINGIVISTTPAPSTITFGGAWAASVNTTSQVTTTYTKTDWTPGQFAWNGIDQNFLMVGLLAALGVFIALGIAYRKTKAALGALLVVCGGAIVLFFTML